MQDAGRSTGLCVTGTMAEFRALSLAEQRLHLEAHPQQVGRVDRVALVEGALVAMVQLWPTAPEVLGGGGSLTRSPALPACSSPSSRGR